VYELYLLPIQRKDGAETQSLTGLFTSAAPRRAQRIRKDDRLLLWLTVVNGQENLLDVDLTQWLKDAARVYFNARGSLTAGLRETANALNARFLEHAERGKTGAKLNMAVLRGEDLYLGHCGAVYTFLLQDQLMKPFFNTASHSQVLGYVDSITPQFFQIKAALNDVLLFSPLPAQGWNRKALTFDKRPSLQMLRKRLLANSQGDFEALGLQLQPGDNGEFHHMRLAAVPEAQPTPAANPAVAKEKVPQPAAMTARRAPSVETKPPSIPQTENKDVPQLESETPEAELPDAVDALLRETAQVEAVSLKVEEPIVEPDDQAEDGNASMDASEEPSTPDEEETAPAEAITNPAVVVPTAPSVFIGSKPTAQPILPTAKPASAGSIEPASDAAPENAAIAEARARRLARHQAILEAARQAQAQAEAETKPAPRTKRSSAPQEPKPSLLESLPLPDVEETKRKFAAFWLKMRQQKAEETDQVVEKSTSSEAAPVTGAAKKALPGLTIAIPQRLMLLIAIAVPLMAAAVAGTVYYQKGVVERFNRYYESAYDLTYQAMTEKDAALRKTQLQEAVQYLDQAEKFRRSDDSRALRTQIETALDDAAGVLRVSLFSALDVRLQDEVSISRLFMINEHDLYALDKTTGTALHFTYDGSRFQLDENFICGASSGDKLVDIAPLPPANVHKADLVGVDSTGSLFYCTNENEPIAQSLVAPVFGWQGIEQMVIERTGLYLLDPKTRALWELYGDQQNYAEIEPYLFFSADPALDLTQVKALDVYNDTMIFVEDSNQVMTCVIQTNAQGNRECFYLPPIGQDGVKLSLEGIDWVGVHAADFPAALYLLDQNAQTLYQFSVQMKLNKSFRFYAASGERLPNVPMTAFTITDSQWVLIAFGNEVFAGQIR